MAISQAEAQAQLDAWLAASLALANGKTYQIGDRILTLSNATEVRRQINYWSRELDLAQGQRLYVGTGGYGRSLPVPLGVDDGTTPS